MSKKNNKELTDNQLYQLGELRNKKIERDHISELKKGVQQSKLLDYALITYINPYNIQKEPISKEFLTKNKKGEFNSNKDIDNFFKKYSEPQEKKESKTGKKIKKLIEKVSNTKISEPSNKKHFDSISSIMDLVGSLIKKPKEKSYPDVNESMAEVNKLT